MAKQTSQKQTDQAGSKGGMLKVALILSGIFAVEIGAIFAYLHYVSGDSPAAASGWMKGDKISGLGLHHLEMTIAEGKFENTVSGQRILYDVKVVAKISKKTEEGEPRFETEDDFKSFQKDMRGLDSQFGDAIASIIRRENPINLRDDHELTYLSNKIRDRLNKIIKDNSRIDQDLINEVLIPRLIELHRS
ncbi:MAG: hypothetical protein R3236_04905 [Phycisphaeraceae bacterium]|nr:hypothetical protein [Phycisphaeraceae bacterium]